MQDRELARLVERTEGLQPLRRLIHLGNGLVVVTAVALWNPPRIWVLGVLGAILALSLAYDLLRLRWNLANRVFFRSFPSLASPRERARIASSTYYVLGVFLVFLLFPYRVALPATLILAVADPTGNLVGRTFRSRPLGTGTVLGTLGLMAASFLAGALFVPPVHAAAAALVVGWVETRPWGLDDNLTVPLAAASVLSLANLVFS